jgi:hypothetical protein
LLHWNLTVTCSLLWKLVMWTTMPWATSTTSDSLQVATQRHNHLTASTCLLKSLCPST